MIRQHLFRLFDAKLRLTPRFQCLWYHYDTSQDFLEHHRELDALVIYLVENSKCRRQYYVILVLVLTNVNANSTKVKQSIITSYTKMSTAGQQVFLQLHHEPVLGSIGKKKQQKRDVESGVDDVAFEK
jgi:hypothetical protein